MANPTVPFGKYKGQSAEEVVNKDKNYAMWLRDSLNPEDAKYGEKNSVLRGLLTNALNAYASHQGVDVQQARETVTSIFQGSEEKQTVSDSERMGSIEQRLKALEEIVLR